MLARLAQPGGERSSTRGGCVIGGRMDFLRRNEPQAYALMRIVTGFLFLWHGM